MSNNGNQSLANPAVLKPFDEKDDEILRIVIETPKGSRNKFAFDAKEKVFELKKVLPAGMTFPWDFGFVPSTLAGDGDPVDVLILMDEPAFPGCVIYGRPIGVIEGEQGEGKDVERNDRIVAVEIKNHQWAHIEHIDELGKKFVKELEEFFVNYHKQSGKKYRILDVGGPGRALKCVQSGAKSQRKKSQAL
jgi:inorganic pyrophosphatase